MKTVFLSKQKPSQAGILLLFCLVILLPAGVTLSSIFSYKFELVNNTLFAAVTALVAIGAMVLFEIVDEPRVDSLTGVFLALLSPFSLINTVFFLLKTPSGWVVISMFICIVCCFWLSWNYGKPKLMKHISLVLSMLMVLPVGFLGFIALIFGNIGQNTVVQSVESPNGTYYADLIDSDQGALGGDTIVEVHENSSIRNFLFVIEKEPQLVYLGEWGEFTDMELYWKNENCLVINDVEYVINE